MIWKTVDENTTMLVQSKGSKGSSQKTQTPLLQWHSFWLVPATKLHIHQFSNWPNRLNNAIWERQCKLSLICLQDRNTTLHEVLFTPSANKAPHSPHLHPTSGSAYKEMSEIQASERSVPHMGSGIWQTWTCPPNSVAQNFCDFAIRGLLFPSFCVFTYKMGSWLDRLSPGSCCRE